MRVKLDSCDHLFVWLDHSLLSEKLLQVIRKIRSTSITRVHGNENAECWLHLDERFLESKLWQVLCFSSEQYKELLGNDREHFNIDSIELIETGPSTRRGETLEEFGNHEMVHTIRAVKHNALFGKGFSEIFS